MKQAFYRVLGEIMKIKIFFFGLILFLCAGVLQAGDIARFVNLGFSDNHRYFMFAQYGVDEESTFPYVDLFLVDIQANQFVSQGVKNVVYKTPSEPGFTGEGGLYTVLEENLSIRKRYNINHLNTGRILYLLVDGEKPKERIDFRDFITGNQYRVELTQNASGGDSDIRSSFHIDLNVTLKSGASRHYLIGLPNHQRMGVKSYRVRQILISPDEKSLIFLVEKEERDKTGSNIRYMIETVRIN